MADRELNLCPIWDITQSHTLAFLKYEPAMVDFSITLGGGRFGVAFALFDPAAFTARFGTPPQPLLHPGDAHGNAQQIANWSASLRKYNVQVDEHLPKLRTAILMAPQEVLEPLKDEYGSLVMRSTADIMNYWRAEYGTLTQADLAILMHQLSIKYDPSKALPAFVAQWNATLRDLTRAGQLLPSTLATQTLQACFGSEFDQCWVDFVKDVPVVANRTVLRLCPAILKFGKDVLPLLKAQASIGINQIIAMEEKLSVVTQQLHALEARHALAVKQAPAVPAAAATPQLGKRSATTNKGAAGKQAKSAPQPFSARPFCWSHGPCQHTGVDCTKPDPGHKENATWQSQMGSKWKTYFQGRGWSAISP